MIAYQPNWYVLEQDGKTAIDFTSFIDVSFSGEGKALSYPTEEGGFASYNKTASPGVINATLGIQGTEDKFQEALEQLAIYQRDPIKLAISTPSKYYEPYTLESYSYERRRDNGAGMLIVQLTFVEVREVRTQVSTMVLASVKNPSSASTVERGRVQAKEVSEETRKSLFKKGVDAVSG